IFAVHPVRKVTLTDKKPRRRSSYCSAVLWVVGNTSSDAAEYLPPWLIPNDGGDEFLECNPYGDPMHFRYASESDALNQLSQWCVRFGRLMAGLPEQAEVNAEALPV